MKTKGKVNATRRRLGKALRYLAGTVTAAIGFYVLFSLLFSTEEERRLQQENDLYATYYQELREKERLVTDVVEGLEVRDDALYRRIFETEAPSVDAVTAADVISVSDSLSESFYLSYSASKSESLRMMAQNVEENFREIYRLMAARKDSIPPLTLPIKECPMSRPAPRWASSTIRCTRWTSSTTASTSSPRRGVWSRRRPTGWSAT